MTADRETVALLGAIWVHDLVNLLAVAETSAVLVERASGDPDKVAKHAGRIKVALASAKELVSRCLAVGRGEPIARRVVGLAPLCRAAWDHAERDGSVVALDVDPLAHVDVFVEPALFGAVLTNLLRNSLEAGASKVGISVRAGAVVVVDDGEGFDEGRAPKGNGIGVAGCRAIMRLHGGALAVEKRASGTEIVLSGEDLVRGASA